MAAINNGMAFGRRGLDLLGAVASKALFACFSVVGCSLHLNTLTSQSSIES
jgi:hypothetical protein